MIQIVRVLIQYHGRFEPGRRPVSRPAERRQARVDPGVRLRYRGEIQVAALAVDVDGEPELVVSLAKGGMNSLPTCTRVASDSLRRTDALMSGLKRGLQPGSHLRLILAAELGEPVLPPDVWCLDTDRPISRHDPVELVDHLLHRRQLSRLDRHGRSQLTRLAPLLPAPTQARPGATIAASTLARKTTEIRASRRATM